MKGGSMTAILLNVIFTAALSQTFAIPLEKFLTPSGAISSDSTTNYNLSLTNEISSNLKNGSSSATELKHTHATQVLTAGQSLIASIVDGFAATYHAAYRLDICTPTNK